MEQLTHNVRRTNWLSILNVSKDLRMFQQNNGLQKMVSRKKLLRVKWVNKHKFKYVNLLPILFYTGAPLALASSVKETNSFSTF